MSKQTNISEKDLGQKRLPRSKKNDQGQKALVLA